MPFVTMYAYCANNPLVYADRDGKWIVEYDDDGSIIRIIAEGDPKKDTLEKLNEIVGLTKDSKILLSLVNNGKDDDGNVKKGYSISAIDIGEAIVYDFMKFVNKMKEMGITLESGIGTNYCKSLQYIWNIIFISFDISYKFEAPLKGCEEQRRFVVENYIKKNFQPTKWKSYHATWSITNLFQHHYNVVISKNLQLHLTLDSHKPRYKIEIQKYSYPMPQDRTYFYIDEIDKFNSLIEEEN